MHINHSLNNIYIYTYHVVYKFRNMIVKRTLQNTNNETITQGMLFKYYLNFYLQLRFKLYLTI